MHLLDCSWTAYAHTLPNSAATYNDTLVYLARIDSCESWGALWPSLPVPRLFVTPHLCLRFCASKERIVALSFFREDIRPEWEDAKNTNGATLSARVSENADSVREIWISLVADCARGAAPDDVTGVQVIQKQSRYACVVRFDIWLSCNADHARAIAWVRESSGIVVSKQPRQLRSN